MKWRNYLWLICLITSLASAQEIRVQGKFLRDSIRIGEPVPYVLSAHYPSHWAVLFPDSLTDFKPFEYHRRNYVPTVTSGGISIDSAIYWVTSFEIDSIQYLSLPVLQLSGSDSIFHKSITDSVFLVAQVKSLPDSIPPANLPLQIDTNYRAVMSLFNYPAFLIGSGIFIVSVILMWVMFGTRIRKWWARRKLTKGFQNFEAAYQKIIEQLKETGGRKEAEQAIRIWKGYLEELEGLPYTKYTSREIYALEQHQEIRDSLMAIDRMIYGSRPSPELKEYYILKSFSEDCYYRKLEKYKS